MKLKILDKLIKRLSNAKSTSSGCLLGIYDEQTEVLWILGLELQLEQGSTRKSFPVGIDVCGSYHIRENEVSATTAKIGSSICDPIEISVTLGKRNVEVIKHGNHEKLEYEVVKEDDVNTCHIFAHCTGGIPIKCECSEQAVKTLFTNLKDFICGSSSIVFNLVGSNIFLTGKKVIGCEENKGIVEIYNEQYNRSEEVIIKRKNVQSNKPRALEIGLMWKKTIDKESEARKHAPVCIINKNSSKVIDTMANVDIIAMFPLSTVVSKLRITLLDSINQYMNLYEKCLIKCVASYKQDSACLNFETFHFYPTECGHFLTVLYPSDEREEDLKSQRQVLHKKLLLDELCPRFRRANRYQFQSNDKPNAILVNPHEAVKPTENGGDIITVRGKYEYYHYCQNGADDNGWGCAYRSLQTLVSWFKLQGYIDKSVPELSDIQKCLVDIKDKPASFLGSKQWIGSTEVSFVLSTLFGIECRILHVSSGDEMATTGPELANHFAVMGTPVMIGGGVLAHTLLGVDYNRQTGTLKFLVLDPHYTGSEDLNVVVNKGWCGWKGADFWDKRCFYNMCLPAVPRGV